MKILNIKAYDVHFEQVPVNDKLRKLQNGQDDD